MLIEFPNKDIQNLINLAKNNNVEIRYVGIESLNKFSVKQPHNRVILRGEKRDYTNIKKFEQYIKEINTDTKKNKLDNIILFIDQVIIFLKFRLMIQNI